MAKPDLSTLASDMNNALNDEDNKKMFSSSSMLEKLAFSRVADEGKLPPTEIEVELEKELTKKASAECCECHPDKKHDECKCHCHSKKEASVSNSINALLKISEDLETQGFEKLAALSAVLAGKLVEAAKAKSKSKSKSDKKDDEKAKSKSKSSKKMTMKERMEKMRKAQKGKKKSKSDAKSKKSTAQAQLQPQSFEPSHPTLRTADTLLNALPASVKAAIARLEADDVNHVLKVQFVPGKASNEVFRAIQNIAARVLPHPYKLRSV